MPESEDVLTQIAETFILQKALSDEGCTFTMFVSDKQRDALNYYINLATWETGDTLRGLRERGCLHHLLHGTRYSTRFKLGLRIGPRVFLSRAVLVRVYSESLKLQGYFQWDWMPTSYTGT